MKALSLVICLGLFVFGGIFLEWAGLNNPAYFASFGYVIGAFQMHLLEMYG